MTKSQHTPTGDSPQNQNNAMSDDPKDGNRESFTTGRDGASRVEKSPDAKKNEATPGGRK